MKRLLIGLLLCVPALAEPLPLRVSVNVACSGDPASPECLHSSHIAKGWQSYPVTDVQCRSAIDPGGCWIKANSLILDATGRAAPRYFSWRLNDRCDSAYPLACISQAQAGLAAREIITLGARSYANLNDLEVRQKYIAAARLELDRFNSPVVLHDNIVHRSSASTWPITWEATCHYLAGLREPGRLIIPNVAGPSAWWSWADLELFAASVDGVAREIGIHPTIRTDHVQLAKQIAADRYMLEKGKWVVLMWVNGVLGKELDGMNATKEQRAAATLAESEYAAAYCLMIRNPGEHCYAHWNYWQAPPDWTTWAEKLGEPLGEHALNANGVMERYFKGGVLRMHPSSPVAPVNAPRVELIEIK